MFECVSMEVQGHDSPSLLSLGCTTAPCLKNSKTWHREHQLTMEKQSKPQRWVWRDKCNCSAWRFPRACRLRVLLLLLLLHFLLHLPAPRSRGARRPVVSAVQRVAPDKRGLGFSSSPGGPHSGGSSSSSAQTDITASPHPR